jgi:excisionase family DNA binding protein
MSNKETPFKTIEQHRKLLTTSETARFLGIGKSTLEQARLSGSLKLKFVRVGRLVRYRINDIEEYISTLPGVTSTTQADALER